jgi:PAS domain S-box-containing protein
MAAYEAEQRRLASLQQAKALDALFGALPVPAGIYDPQGMLRYANASYLSMLGKTPDTATGRPLDQIWPRRAASIHAPYLAQTADGQSGRFALSFTTPDNVNREFDVCMVPQPLPEGGRFDTLMLLLDRTENARAARALAERDNMYSAMVEHAPVAILTEVNGLVTFANPGALSMLGAEWAGRVVGRPFADFVVDDDRPRMRTRLAALAHAPGFAEFRPYRLSTLGGHVRDVELAAISVTRDGRQLVELFCVDTTERRTAEEKIRLLNETLELRVAERTSELEAFTTSVSHDLRAPARQVVAAADVMLAKADAPGSDLKPMLSALRTTAERMNRTIDALLELSRVGRASMLQSVWPLGAMLHEIQSELSCLEPASRRIEWRIAPMPRVFADPQLIRLVLVNVLGNALKFSRNGHLTVVEIWSEERDQMIEIHVRDNGKGFDMKHAGKLFQMFSRLHSSSDFEGTGVGLAHCRRIVERHGGRIAARGVPDQGATVSFTLPHESASL